MAREPGRVYALLKLVCDGCNGRHTREEYGKRLTYWEAEELGAYEKWCGARSQFPRPRPEPFPNNTAAWLCWGCYRELVEGP